MNGYDFSNFWKDVHNEYQTYQKLSLEEKLKIDIHNLINCLDTYTTQHIRDYNGHYLGKEYIIADYTMEKILNVLKETQNIFKGGLRYAKQINNRNQNQDDEKRH